MPTHYSVMENQPLGKKSTPNSKIPFKLTTDKLPPEDKSVLLIWEKDWGYNVRASYLVHQHVKNDIKILGKPRITHWLMLEKIKGDHDEREKDSTKTAGKKGKKKRKIILKRKRN